MLIVAAKPLFRALEVTVLCAQRVHREGPGILMRSHEAAICDSLASNRRAEAAI